MNGDEYLIGFCIGMLTTFTLSLIRDYKDKRGFWSIKPQNQRETK